MPESTIPQPFGVPEPSLVPSRAESPQAERCDSHLIADAHGGTPLLADCVEQIIKRLKARGDTATSSLADALQMVAELQEFELGRFLLMHRGLNGYWTDFLVSYPDRSSSYQCANELEEFILTKAPIVRATQERFRIFKALCQSRIQDSMQVASIPCGLMSDLLTLDYREVRPRALCGIDVDSAALRLAATRAEELGLAGILELRQEDIFQSQALPEFDLIVSNGLNIYLKTPEEQVCLYKHFFDKLHEGGALITSFLTPPPTPELSYWQLAQINPQDGLRQRTLFVDILDAQWQSYVSPALITEQLIQAGFCEVEVFEDHAHIFPTVVATKKRAACDL